MVHFRNEGRSAMKRLSALWANDKLFEQSNIVGRLDAQVSSLSLNSNRCKKHSIFVAQTGLHTDGHRYIDSAIDHGASVIIHSSPLSSYQKGITYIEHPYPQAIASHLGYQLYTPYPQQIIAVTGTDGKSTTCEFLYRLLIAQGIKCAILSTISMDDGTGHRPSLYRQSTPEVEYLYPFLHRCYEQGVEIVILEATSHALSHKTSRLSSIEFSGAIITNITSEHLDFHHTIDSYVDDKINIVRQLKTDAPLVIEQSFAYRNLPEIEAIPSNRLKTFSMKSELASLYGQSEEVSLKERKIIIREGENERTLNFSFAPLVYSLNLLAAFSMTLHILKRSLNELNLNATIDTPITGRYQLVHHNGRYPIIIDFAHTERSFEALFSFIAKTVPHSSITVLFGCAGERDTTKRAPMGRIAGTYCKKIYLTNEDPRQEDPMNIINQIIEGIPTSSTAEIFTIIDRTQAVEHAISHLKPHEILLLLGKGHEKSIELYDTIKKYDEYSCVKDSLQKGNKHER